VAELYLSATNKTEQSAISSLKGFQRLALKAGETKKVNFVVKPVDFSDALEGNDVRISVGGSQPGFGKVQEAVVPIN